MTSYKSWTQKDKNQVENFFLLNPFFSKFYQIKKFEQISRICLYRKLEPNEHMILENNNRAEAIVLLSGHIIVKKRQRQRVLKKRLPIFDDKISQIPQRVKRANSKRNSYEIQQIILADMKQFNQTVILNSQCSVLTKSSTPSQIIFIPCALYYKLQEQTQTQRVTKIELVLERFFFRLKKKEIQELSQASCVFREFKMNNYIYRASSKPEEVFLLVQGIVKLEKPGFSQKTLQETILVNSGMIFGDSDLRLQQRTRNAIACSSHVQVLSIPKSQFLKYALRAFPDMMFESINLQLKRIPLRVDDENPKTARSVNNSPQMRINLFPSIGRLRRFHTNTQRQETKITEISERREYQLIKNSHMLVDIKSKAKSNFKLKTFSPKAKEEIAFMIKKQQYKMKDLKQVNIQN